MTLFLKQQEPPFQSNAPLLNLSFCYTGKSGSLVPARSKHTLSTPALREPGPPPSEKEPIVEPQPISIFCFVVLFSGAGVNKGKVVKLVIGSLVGHSAVLLISFPRCFSSSVSNHHHVSISPKFLSISYHVRLQIFSYTVNYERLTYCLCNTGFVFE